MARDLAKRETPFRSQPQRTFRRETTMPRQSTDLPGLAVNADIRRPDMSGAEQLSKILGLASDLGQNIIRDKKEAADKRDEADAIQAFNTGQDPDERFAKSRAYLTAWQIEGSKKLAVDISQEVTEGFNQRLNDPDNPPTIDELHSYFEETIKSHLTDENGQPLDFITPEAKKTLGLALGRLKAELMPKAADAIRVQQDERLFETKFSNMLFERDAGAKIGEEPQPVQPTDPLAPLPEGQEEASTATPKVAPQKGVQVSFGEPTGKPPLAGKVTATLAQHRARGSMGVDIDGKIGDPIQAPAGGKVKVSRDGRAGLHVIIDHGNGVTSSYSHLSKTDLKNGQVLKAGDVLGLVGNTGNTSKGKGGDGSHLHWRVKVNGKDVDPLSYAFKAGGGATQNAESGHIPTGAEPELVAEATAPVPSARPGFDLEGFMGTLPPSVNRREAKSWALKSVVQEAMRTKDPSLLNGLEDLTRADGTPSLNPTERKAIAEARDHITDKVFAEAKQAESRRHEENVEKILEAWESGNTPTDEFIKKAALDDLIPDTWAMSFIKSREVEARTEERILRAEERDAEREAEAGIDAEVASMVALRHTGITASAAEDQRLFESGQLGSGKKAATRFRQLRAASRAGEQVLQQNPTVRQFAAAIETNFKPKSGKGGSLVERARGAGGGDAGDLAAYRATLQSYNNLVRTGMNPGEAYLKAVSQYGPKNDPDTAKARNAYLAQLQKRRMASGR